MNAATSPPLRQLARVIATALVLFGAVSTPPVSAQALPVAPNRLYVEAFGSGLVYSFNYERELSEHLNVRVGVGGLPFQSVQYVGGFGMLGTALGSRQHSLRLAAGGGLLYAIDVWVIEAVNNVYAYGTASVGYQFQPRARGLFFRAACTPVFTTDEAFLWGGISLGWDF
ncbi:MAG: hypothetical protein OEO20_06825 [Gemmatimonadota bacterium]|nr:hypothetical protein [Gemmatimonadota bacterium]MDH3367902.1 hypothetical protein [Gemmatimonadota bacterium]MDH3478000.1 hypothetical protein [Gemmatimonadota bacterium]MDH3570422.1 hypothetical protein [Gemmatimonadota bacterium]MDH5549052.1 hypothetical protein [Gemmatimonadota bacterium]